MNEQEQRAAEIADAINGEAAIEKENGRYIVASADSNCVVETLSRRDFVAKWGEEPDRYISMTDVELDRIMTSPKDIGRWMDAMRVRIHEKIEKRAQYPQRN